MKKQWILAGAIAAMMTASSQAILAQGSMSGGSGSGMMSGAIDYSVLGKMLPYDYTTLMAAKSRGYTENQVASMAKISTLSSIPFGQILRQVETGATFNNIAYEYNLKLADVLDASDYKDKISNYIAAYESTGKGAMMKSGMSGGMSAMPMASKTTPMAPTPMTPPAPMATPAAASATGTMDIVDTAVAAGNFRRLVALVRRAGLVDTLKGPGPFTVFAPTDEAFAKIPRADLAALRANPDQLKKVLTYHVIPGKITAADAMSMTSPTSPATVEGDTIQVTTTNGMVMLNGNATVIKADIVCSNGVIHVIDTVLMPPAPKP